jgi:Xaa-Pro dipeptidase
MLLNRVRANLIMDQHGLDGLVAAFNENIYYLSDYWGPMLLMSRNYSMYAVLPRDEAMPAALIMPTAGAYHLEHLPTWMPNVVTFNQRMSPRKMPVRDFDTNREEVEEGPLPLQHDPSRRRIRENDLRDRDHQLLARRNRHADDHNLTALDALTRALEMAGLETARLGFDDPRVLGWLKDSALPSITGIDALNVFKRIRMVKSESEIDLLKIAGRSTEKAVNDVIDAMEVGMPLRDVELIHQKSMADQGGQSIFIIANVRGLATGVFEANEVVKIDAVGSYREYRGDVGRSVYFGTPPEEMLVRNKAVMHGLDYAYRNIRPGRTASEICRETMNAVQAAGFPGFTVAGPHSVGLEHTDHPTSVGGELPGDHGDLVFEENMVFTLDMPYHEFGWGSMHVEDMVIVRKDGCEPITSLDTSLRIKPI